MKIFRMRSTYNMMVLRVRVQEGGGGGWESIKSNWYLRAYMFTMWAVYGGKYPSQPWSSPLLRFYLGSRAFSHAPQTQGFDPPLLGLTFVIISRFKISKGRGVPILGGTPPQTLKISAYTLSKTWSSLQNLMQCSSIPYTFLNFCTFYIFYYRQYFSVLIMLYYDVLCFFFAAEYVFFYCMSCYLSALYIFCVSPTMVHMCLRRLVPTTLQLAELNPTPNRAL